MTTPTLPRARNLTMLRSGEIMYKRTPEPCVTHASKVMCPYCGQIQVPQNGRCFSCEGEWEASNGDNL